MTDFAQFAVLGLGVGAIYALLAQGIVLIYRGSGVVNFAHGAVALSGAIAFTELRSAGVPTIVAVLAAGAVGALFGFFIQVVIMRRLRMSAPITRVIATLAVLISVQAGAALHYGDQVRRVEQFLPQEPWDVFGVVVQSDRLALVLIAVLLTVALIVVQRRWVPALATRAAAENELSAATLGWSPEGLATASWVVGGALAGLAGAFIVPLTGLLVASLVMLVVPALAAALLGRFDAFGVTLLGALGIGIVQSLILRYWDQTGASEAVPFLVIVAVLVVTGQAVPLRSHLTDRLPTIGRGLVRPLPAAIAFAVVAYCMLSVFSTTWLDAVTVSLSMAIVLLSVVVLTGYAGQISLAQYAIAGLGAFVAGRLVATQGLPFWLATVIGIAAAVPIGVVFALPALRTRGVTLAVVTLGMGVAVSAMLFNNVAYTGGIQGTAVGETELFGLSISSIIYPERYAIVALVAFTLVALMVANVRRGPSGRRLIAIRENERAATSLGISVVSAKLFAFALAAAIAALGGILIGFRNTSIIFTEFTPLDSITVVGLAVLGGVGYVLGPLLGSTLTTGGIGSLLDPLFHGIQDYLMLIGGLAILVTLLLNPDGIVSGVLEQGRWLADRVRRLRGRSTGRARRAVITLADGAARGAVEPKPLRVDGLTVRFGGVVAVDDVSVAVQPREIVGLIGPNGAGKTTLIDAVTGFVPATQGSFAIGDQDLTGSPGHRRVSAGLARSWQSLELFEDVTVAENLLIASDERRWHQAVTSLVRPGRPTLGPAAVAAVDEFQLRDDLDRLPGDLPYGRRRLVAIARAVALRPSVLLLDEPAAGLSTTESQELGTLLRRLSQSWGMGILLVEHDVDLVMSICDRVVVLDFGRKIAEGPPEEVRNDPAVVAAYLGTTEAAVGAGQISPGAKP